MAYLSIFAGLVVLFSIARYEVKSRFWEINLLKILGANFGDVKSIVQIEFGILGFFAAITGVVLSLLMSYSISYSSLIVCGGFRRGHYFQHSRNNCVEVATALIATRSSAQQKPLELLRAVW